MTNYKKFELFLIYGLMFKEDGYIYKAFSWDLPILNKCWLINIQDSKVLIHNLHH